MIIAYWMYGKQTLFSLSWHSGDTVSVVVSIETSRSYRWRYVPGGRNLNGDSSRGLLHLSPEWAAGITPGVHVLAYAAWGNRCGPV